MKSDIFCRAFLLSGAVDVGKAGRLDDDFEFASFFIGVNFIYGFDIKFDVSHIFLLEYHAEVVPTLLDSGISLVGV